MKHLSLLITGVWPIWLCILAGLFSKVQLAVTLSVEGRFFPSAFVINSVSMAELHATATSKVSPPLLGPPQVPYRTSTHPHYLVMIGIVCQVSHFHKAGKFIVSCWIPGDMGIPINEAASATTKKFSLCGNITPEQALHSDVYNSLFHAVYLPGKMDSYTEQVNSCKTACRDVAVRREEVIVVWLQINYI